MMAVLGKVKDFINDCKWCNHTPPSVKTLVEHLMNIYEVRIKEVRDETKDR